MVLVTDEGDTLSEEVNQLGASARFEKSALFGPTPPFTVSPGTPDEQLREGLLKYIEEFRDVGDAAIVLTIEDPIVRPDPYTLFITAREDAEPGDTYTITLKRGSQTIELAKDRPVPIDIDVIVVPFDSAEFGRPISVRSKTCMC